MACLLDMPMDRWRLFKMFLSSFLEGLGGFPYVFLITVKVVTLVAVNYSTLSLGSWSLGFISTCLIVVLPLKWTCIPYLPHICLMLLPIPFVYGITTWPTVFLLALVLLFWLLPGLLFCVVLLLLSMVCVVVSWPLLLLLLGFVGGLLSSRLLFRTLFWTLLIAWLG